MSYTASGRAINPPSRFQDETYGSGGPYDRCVGGYMWPALHKDHFYRQPKRDGIELDEEELLVRHIRGGRQLNNDGYIEDGFIVNDSSDYESDVDDEVDEEEYESEESEEEYESEESEEEYESEVDEEDGEYIPYDDNNQYSREEDTD